MSIDAGKEANQVTPSVSQYTDYREFLKDFFQFKKQTESTPLRPYSYAHFSASADIKSPNYLKLIIEGKRNLSEQMISKFAKALRLNKAEGEEFRVLVLYGQATEPLMRNRFLKELSELRARRDLARGAIDQKVWEQVPDWLTWVIYAMVDQKDFELNDVLVQKKLRNHASLDQIKEAIRHLSTSGHISRDPETNLWIKKRPLVDAGEDVPVELVRRLQSELIYLGLESLFRDSAKDREFGAFTLALTKEEFERIRFELRKVRKTILKDIMTRREQSKGDRVYQLNMQLFALTDEGPILHVIENQAKTST